MKDQPLTFKLCYRRECYVRQGTKLVRIDERDKTLPRIPPQFTPLVGDHPTVAARADELNKAQERSGFLDYFFFPDLPEPVKR